MKKQLGKITFLQFVCGLLATTSTNQMAEKTTFLDLILILPETNNLKSNFNFLNLLTDVKPEKVDFYKNFDFDTSLNLKYEYKDSNVFHLDEKWFRSYYYHDFDYCCFDEALFDNLLNIYNKKTKSKLVISTGHIKVDFIENLNRFFLNFK